MTINQEFLNGIARALSEKYQNRLMKINYYSRDVKLVAIIQDPSEAKVEIVAPYAQGAELLELYDLWKEHMWIGGLADSVNWYKKIQDLIEKRYKEEVENNETES